jgi:hypothetical protein
MDTILTWFWTAMIFASIAWYAILLFYVGTKGGREIIQMVRTLSERPEGQD